MAAEADTISEQVKAQFLRIHERDQIDEKMGYSRFTSGSERLGWLVNMQETLVRCVTVPNGRAAIDLYFIEEDGNPFKATILYDPYFYVLCKPGAQVDVDDYIRRTYGKLILSITEHHLEDLQMPNHLVGNKRTVLKLTFPNNQNLMLVRRGLQKIMASNKTSSGKDEFANDLASIMIDYHDEMDWDSGTNGKDAMLGVMDIREHDIQYYVRTAMDNDIRVGIWYDVTASQGQISLRRRDDIVNRADPIVLAYDIETSKSPLKFPDASVDQIMMISYMIDGQGFLITNRDIISEDIHDFEYTPLPEYEGIFTIYNEQNEYQLLKRFFEHILEVRPNVFVSYNGDFFDWPYVDKRARIYGLEMDKIIGFYTTKSSAGDEYLSFHASHIDCLYWVKRDSYLPQGSHGLKAVTKSKLGYQPIEVDPEDMTRFARDDPQTLAKYSVSDAVATYYLYMKYIHPFIFSLCNIIPMNPDEVLRRGSGTLCETLLMVESFKAKVIMPNKHNEKSERSFEGHLLESETYVGGHVEALKAGVYRSDIPVQFSLVPSAYHQLIEEIDQALTFCIEVEGNLSKDHVLNYHEVKQAIVDKLSTLKEKGTCMETPLIYHLDVSAMYPNIILTNRLQPDAMVEETTCAACDFNEGPNSSCQRRLPWLWRGEYFPASRGEIKMIKNQLQNERFTRKNGNNELEACSFHDLPEAERMSHIKKRVGDYSRKVYKRLHENKVIEKEAIICQRENPFYINTVRSFRDRRYEYKTLHKVWKKKLDDAQAEDDIVAAEESKKMIVVYDSLQLAHKCILNSFYGYVMRKGARWYSMEMAGIVCLTGSTIIQLARSRIEQLGTPLELDTDGIWCILPSSFPETFKFELSNGKTYNISYPCVMLNHLVHARFTNHQYQDRVDPHRNEFSVRSENSIFFEVDGPYKAMILPASLEEDKLLKKRYAVFDHSDKMTELKGFEMKRRGELKMIKEFQTEIFKYFLKGQTLQECYEEVAKVANRWLDILFTKGAKVDDEELFDLISENRSMSKSLAEYGSQKSTSICTAKRLADLLGSQTVKDKGLNCRFVISAKPAGTPVSERAVPVVIFKTEEEEKKRFLRKWLRDTNLNDFDIRSILDWNYYLERFGSVLQKLITIPAAMQGVKNPIERIAHPDWLKKRLTSGNQQKINELFNLRPIKAVDSDKENESSDDGILAEIEDNIPVDRSIKKVAPVPPTISPFQNYSEYLQSAKAYWRTERKRIASMAHSAGPAKRVQLNTHVSDVGQFFRKETSILLQSKWHILQVFETDIPGECRLWVVINNGLYQFKLSVPRVFYVNSSSEEQPVMDRSDIEVTRVNKTLPRGRPVLNLYQFSLPEPVYREHINLFASLFNHPDIDGVYESQVPLLFRALIHMGCVCSVSAKDSLEDGLKFKDISSATKDTASYLKGIVMNHIYVFHTFSGQRQVIGAISIEEGHGALFFSSPGGEEPAVNIQSLYQESYVAYTADSEASFVYPESVDFTTFLFKLESDMVTGFGRWIRDYQDRKRGATLVLLQTPTIANLYLQKFGYLKDFPHLFIPTHQSDVLLPVFGWQSYAVQRMMSHYFNVEPWLRERMELSRYADVPMCNLEIDYPIFLTDLFLARGLQKQEHLLWMSNSDRPDLGGRERDIFPSQLDVGDDSEQNLSGLYTQYCVEFNLMNLAFNTLIQSTTLSQNEQTVQGFNHQAEKITVSSGLIQTADERLSSQTMHIVRTLVKSWWVQAIETGNKYPETMLEHFYRWVRTPKSKLYDPLMYASIHQLMMAVYRRLIAEFQHLGATVIYANFDKIIIQTTKTSAQRAHQYAKYIKDTIAAKPIFHLLTLQEEKIWDVLVWYNHQNFGGYTIDQEELRESGVLCHWTLGKYLPVGCQGTFETTLIQYITQIHDFFTDHRSKSIDSIDKATKSTLQEQFRVFLSTFLNQTIKRELLKSVPKMYREWQKMEAREEEDHPYLFPVLPGSYETLTNPILEFIKYISMLLSLGGVCERENQLLKRDLLSLIGVGEYSELALFKNPCETFKLKQVICEYCCSTHDLDLTGDLTLLEQEDQVRAQWICAECGSEYDRLSIERQLMTLLKQYLSAWQLQDVVCTKCRMVCETNLSSYCACSGTIKEEMDSTIILRRVTVMANISKFYRLELLEEMSRWVLEQF